ncbi:MAG: hypothetical protein K0R59_3759 [Sphingobacterium sp.]|jgi:hypothetical protein|nr:hypothetical protein [Sphingobacterium sp.]
MYFQSTKLQISRECEIHVATKCIQYFNLAVNPLFCQLDIHVQLILIIR